MYKPTGIPSIVFAYYKQFFTSEDVKWWTGVMWIACELINKLFYQLFGLSFWRHPFTAEDPFSNQVK